MSRPNLGQDTFRGLGSSSQLRNTLFAKTLGEVELQRDLLSVESPISGSILTAPDLARRTAIKDPISGATLQLVQHHAEVVAPVLRQQQVSQTHMSVRYWSSASCYKQATSGVHKYDKHNISTRTSCMVHFRSAAALWSWPSRSMAYGSCCMSAQNLPVLLAGGVCPGACQELLPEK